MVCTDQSGRWTKRKTANRFSFLVENHGKMQRSFGATVLWLQPVRVSIVFLHDEDESAAGGGHVEHDFLSVGSGE